MTPTLYSRKMDRRERRRRARERKKIEEKLHRETAQAHAQYKQSVPPLRRGLIFLRRTLLGTKVLWALVIGGLTLLGGYPLLHPNVSVEPGLLLNPGDPFSTEFTLKNDNPIFEVKDLRPVCRTIYVTTTHNFGMFGLPPRPSPLIPILGPEQETTTTCLPIVGGLGAYNRVLSAYIEIDLGYRQDGWPFAKRERFPLRAVVDSQNSVHWTHITPEELQADLSKNPIR